MKYSDLSWIPDLVREGRRYPKPAIKLTVIVFIGMFLLATILSGTFKPVDYAVAQFAAIMDVVVMFCCGLAFIKVDAKSKRGHRI